MEKLTVQLDQLIAQRKILSFNFCCYKESFVDNTQKLVAVAQLIQLKNNNQCILSAQNTAQIIEHLHAEYKSKNEYGEHELVLILSLKLMIKPQLQRQVLTMMLNSQQPYLQSLSLAVAMQLGSNLNFIIDFINEFSLPITQIGAVNFNDKIHLQDFIQQALFNQYYNQTLNIYLNDQLSEYKNLNSREASAVELSAINWLTIDVLSDNEIDVEIITAQFIQHEYLSSPLFEIYITSLNEHEVTQVLNLLSADESFIPIITHAMALSGYSKFIPFLAQYLQQADIVLDAYQALRLLMGSKLDTLIPLSVQFNNDGEERNKDLQYYGAKILNAWQQGISFLGLTFEQANNKRLLNGLELSVQSIEKISISGSQWHRHVAMLHKQQCCVTPYHTHTHTHAHALEAS